MIMIIMMTTTATTTTTMKTAMPPQASTVANAENIAAVSNSPHKSCSLEICPLREDAATEEGSRTRPQAMMKPSNRDVWPLNGDASPSNGLSLQVQNVDNISRETADFQSRACLGLIESEMSCLPNTLAGSRGTGRESFEPPAHTYTLLSGLGYTWQVEERIFMKVKV